MKTLTALGLILGLSFGADQSASMTPLDGTWTLASGEADGKALTEAQRKDAKLVIQGTAYSVTLPERGTVKGTLKLDPKAMPQAIDITDASGVNQGKTCLGIYERKGDEFRVAFAPPGKARPSQFSASADSGTWVHAWKRAKE
jgi:uncharacterized protein (TIGR03067 family)